MFLNNLKHKICIYCLFQPKFAVVVFRLNFIFAAKWLWTA